MHELKLSITEQQVHPQTLCMQYCLKNQWPDQALFKHSLHTNCVLIQQSCVITSCC